MLWSQFQILRFFSLLGLGPPEDGLLLPHCFLLGLPFFSYCLTCSNLNWFGLGNMFMNLNLSICEPNPFRKNVTLRLLYVDLKVFQINSNVKI